MTADNATSRWFIRHGYQRQDIMRGAQNAADQTGVPQFVYRLHTDADTIVPDTMVNKNPDTGVIEAWHLEQVVHYDEVRARAGNPGGALNWETHG